MYFYWKRLCILIVIYVYLLLVYVIVVYVFLDAATLTEVFPCFFLSCKANARVNLAKTGHGPHCPKLLCCSMYRFVSFCVLFVCKCVLYYCHRVTTQLQLINISYQILIYTVPVSYHSQYQKTHKHIQEYNSDVQGTQVIQGQKQLNGSTLQVDSEGKLREQCRPKCLPHKVPICSTASSSIYLPSDTNCLTEEEEATSEENFTTVEVAST